MPDKKPMPFVKWVGGKRNLLRYIVPNMPTKFKDYYEPFVGGGAVFFSVYDKVKNTALSDSNLDLIITYKAIQKEPRELIEMLREHQRQHNKEYYYEIRSKELDNPMEIAARFIYLNKTCYNGLYRVNRQGLFNVPMGDYKKPNILNEENILSCHNALKRAKVEYADFEEIQQPKKGDFVYCDPPYHPTDEVSFTQYTKHDFTEKDQIRLRDYVTKLSKEGVYVMLSNSDCKFIRDIYKSKTFHKNTVLAPRVVNCKADMRGNVKELLITNYEVDIKCNPAPKQSILETS